MPHRVQKKRFEIFAPHSYVPRLPSPARSVNASGFTMAPIAPTLAQIEQLHIPPLLVSTSTSNRTAPQWQPPWCFPVLMFVLLRG